MTKVPEDIQKKADEISLNAVSGMCHTYRHDYGLLPEEKRKALYITMTQIAYHDLRPHLVDAIMAERERCAEIVRTEEELDGDPPPHVVEAMHHAGPVMNARSAIRATKASILKRMGAA